MALLALPPELLQALTTRLTPADVRSLRLLSRAAFTAFSNPAYCAFLLVHFFPFAALTADPQPTAYDAFNTLCMRRHRLHASNWTHNLDLVFPPDESSAERVYPGFHCFCSSTGALVTAAASLEHRTLEVSIRWLGGGGDADGRCVVIPAPLEIDGVQAREETGSPVGGFMPRCPPEIIFNDGRVLLVYPRDSFGGLAVKGSIGATALLLDARTDAHTVWHATFNTPIYAGTTDARGEKRLAPVFNRHYIAFLTTLSTAGTFVVARLPAEARHSKAGEIISASLPVRPDNLVSMKADKAGRVLLVSEVFPAHNNLHRVVVIDALTGDATRAFHMPMAPTFATASRDWSFTLTPDERSLLMFASPRHSTYRAALVGQVALFPLSGTGGTRIRYLLSPAIVTLPTTSYNATFYADLNLVMLLPSTFPESAAAPPPMLISYLDLALTCVRAGSGEIATRHNTRAPHFLSTLHLPSVPVLPPVSTNSLALGSDWAYVRSHIPSSDETAIHLLRVADSLPAVADLELPRLASRGSFRSSGVSSPLSIAPGNDGYHAQTVVDAEELAARLRAVTVAAAVGDRHKEEIAYEYGGLEVSGGMGGAVIAGGSGWSDSWGEVRERGKGVVERVEDVLRRAKSEKQRRRGDSCSVAPDVDGIDEPDAHGNGHGHAPHAHGYVHVNEHENGHATNGGKMSRVQRSRSYDPEGVWGWLRRGRRNSKAKNS